MKNARYRAADKTDDDPVRKGARTIQANTSTAKQLHTAVHQLLPRHRRLLFQQLSISNRIRLERVSSSWQHMLRQAWSTVEEIDLWTVFYLQWPTRENWYDDHDDEMVQKRNAALRCIASRAGAHLQRLCCRHPFGEDMTGYSEHNSKAHDLRLPLPVTSDLMSIVANFTALLTLDLSAHRFVDGEEFHRLTLLPVTLRELRLWLASEFGYISVSKVVFALGRLCRLQTLHLNVLWFSTQRANSVVCALPAHLSSLTIVTQLRGWSRGFSKSTTKHFDFVRRLPKLSQLHLTNIDLKICHVSAAVSCPKLCNTAATRELKRLLREMYHVNNVGMRIFDGYKFVSVIMLSGRARLYIS